MNTWMWQRNCEEPARLAVFRRLDPDGKTRFRADWWREWRTQCLLRGPLEPKQVKAPE